MGKEHSAVGWAALLLVVLSRHLRVALETAQLHAPTSGPTFVAPRPEGPRCVGRKAQAASGSRSVLVGPHDSVHLSAIRPIKCSSRLDRVLRTCERGSHAHVSRGSPVQTARDPATDASSSPYNQSERPPPQRFSDARSRLSADQLLVDLQLRVDGVARKHGRLPEDERRRTVRAGFRCSESLSQPPSYASAKKSASA
jgi:hypothetical protein